MLKYIQITTGDGVELLSADAILYAESVDSTNAKLHLVGAAAHIAVAGTDLTSGFAEAINSALQIAGETNWMKTTSIVDLGAMTVTSLTVTAGV